MAARSIVFTAEDPRAALAAPARFGTVAVSADGAYRDAVLAAIPDLKHRFLNVCTWCDCRDRDGDPPGTPPEEAAQLASDLGLPFWVGQGESQRELNRALGAGARIIVGNANAWTDDARAMFARDRARGLLALIQEAYWNVDGPPPRLYGTQGVPVASFCIGTYDASGENPGRGRYVPVAEYRANTDPDEWSRISIYRAECVRADDWVEFDRT